MKAWNALPVFLSFPAFATDDKPAETLSDISIGQMLMPLLLVIALIFLLTWMVKKIHPSQRCTGKDITLLSVTPVSNQARLCLVRISNKDILVGVTSHQVSHIATFNEPVTENPDSQTPSALSERFNQLLAGDKNKKG
ncbi:flagellar biosynthetic protein FliO [Candidatus Sororendozoicomonas aggregata]|uniref:FliO/MopB family protein n=1 Tax=Candidatus Sororendozoicomonas aggregata TaxID=3073239 RepID=UPI002ED38BC0